MADQRGIGRLELVPRPAVRQEGEIGLDDAGFGTREELSAIGRLELRREADQGRDVVGREGRDRRIGRRRLDVARRLDDVARGADRRQRLAQVDRDAVGGRPCGIARRLDRRARPAARRR
ncbi:hypothetical protein [Sphingomonas sp. Root720]|uniref:hypothetical protein n=1 Tax=Sphingomonas sp. Root720 TaxID=1736595 RepID=UPI0006F28335|nr:hypothetical protein [Sphingomonas sp. Root720]KRB89558.1 hypothetical protein ASE22_18025 [Sphingomonas sp. Root720]